MKEHIRNLQPLPPASFLELEFSVPERNAFPERNLFRTPYLLPDLTELLLDDPLAQCAMRWDQKGLEIAITCEASFETGGSPSYRRGDSVELFFNTRPENTAPIPTRFCHHFVFVPGEEPLEMTRLRADEERPLCEPGLLRMEIERARKTRLFLKISREALYEFDPKKGLGFACRINTAAGETQHFPISSAAVSLETHPRMWGKLALEGA